MSCRTQTSRWQSPRPCRRRSWLPTWPACCSCCSRGRRSLQLCGETEKQCTSRQGKNPGSVPAPALSMQLDRLPASRCACLAPVQALGWRGPRAGQVSEPRPHCRPSVGRVRGWQCEPVRPPARMPTTPDSLPCHDTRLPALPLLQVCQQGGGAHFLPGSHPQRACRWEASS